MNQLVIRRTIWMRHNFIAIHFSILQKTNNSFFTVVLSFLFALPHRQCNWSMIIWDSNRYKSMSNFQLSFGFYSGANFPIEQNSSIFRFPSTSDTWTVWVRAGWLNTDMLAQCNQHNRVQSSTQTIILLLLKQCNITHC